MYKFIFHDMEQGGMDDVAPYVNNTTSTSRELLYNVLESGNDAQCMLILLKKCTQAYHEFKFVVARDNTRTISGLM